MFDFSAFTSTLLGNKKNLLYTILVIFNQFAYGLSCIVLISPLVDLRFIYHVDLNTISYISIPVSVGYLLGSLTSYLDGWISRQLRLVISVIIFALTIVAVPFYGHLGLLWAMLAVCGIGSGAWDSSTSIWLVEMWPVGHGAMLQINQFLFGIGTILAPILVAPFVHGEEVMTASNETITEDDRIKALAVPFIISGVIQGIVPLLLCFLLFIYPYEKPSASKEVPSKTSKQEKLDSPVSEPSTASIPCRNLKIALVGLTAACYVSTEINYMTYSTPMWQYLPIALPAAEANHVQAILSATYTLGRLLTAFISLKLKPDIIISYHYLLIIGSMLFIYLAQHNLQLIYISTALLGYGFSAMWPAMFAFTAEHLHLTDRIASLYSLLTGLIGLVVPLVLGQTFSQHPSILFVINGAFICLSLALFIIVRVMIWVI